MREPTPRTRRRIRPRARARWSAFALALLAVVATLLNASMVWLRLRILWRTPGTPHSAIDRWLSSTLGPVAHNDSLFFPAHYFLIALVVVCSVAAVTLAVRAWRSKAQAKDPAAPPIPLP